MLIYLANCVSENIQKVVQHSAQLARIKVFSVSAFAQLGVSTKTDVCVSECEETQVARDLWFLILSVVLMMWQASVRTTVQSQPWSLGPKQLPQL